MANKYKIYSLFIRGDGFEKDFANYSQTENKDLLGFKEIIREQKYKVSDTKIKYRVMSHWEKMGLLPDNLRKDKDIDGWRRFCFVELVWIKVIEQLRKFGLSLETIKEAKEKIMFSDKKKERYPLFEFYVVRACVSSVDPYVVVSKEGISDVGSFREMETIKVLFGSKSMVLISLKEIISGLGIETVSPDILFSLTKEEEKILDAARSKDIDGFSVKKKNKKIVGLKTERIISSSGIKEAIDKIEKEGSFAEVTARYEEGKEQSFSVVKKSKF
jgi:DNA-binding transcriptional MerR regulator